MLALRGRVISSAVASVSKRFLGLTNILATDADQRFESAKTKLDSLTEDPGNDTKLKMYALFKQATVGSNNTDKPGAFNFVAQVKWSAWNDLGEMSQDEAKNSYADIVDDLATKEGKWTVLIIVL